MKGPVRWTGPFVMSALAPTAGRRGSPYAPRMDDTWTPVADPAELGAAIRRARGERGWDQATLADRIGVTRMTL
jgi:ribosome-binding protein aMBF1 (putative translation factor)